MPQKHKHNSPAREETSGMGPDGKPKPWLAAIYKEAGNRYGVPPQILIAQGFQESSFRKYARSEAGAYGPAQFLVGTAKENGLKVGRGVDERTDYVKAIHAQARYMRKNLEQFGGDVELALAGYISGPYGVAKRVEKGLPPTPTAKEYARKIMRKANWNPEQKVDVQERLFPNLVQVKRKGPVSELTPTQPTAPELAAPTRVVARMGR